MSKSELFEINPDDLVPMNYFEGTYPIKIDLVYSQPEHPDNKFKNLYHPQAKILWVHKDLAPIILSSAIRLHRECGWILKLNDCLRTVEAQQEMLRYNYHPSLVSTPGNGAHPRAMAIDVVPMYSDGQLVEMGTRFDHFVKDPEKDENSAGRSFRNFQSVGFNEDESEDILLRRYCLDRLSRCANVMYGRSVIPLPEEWWHYHLDVWSKFSPLYESDLHPYQRLINPDAETVKKILNGDYPASVLRCINQVERSFGNAEIGPRMEDITLTHL